MTTANTSRHFHLKTTAPNWVERGRHFRDHSGLPDATVWVARGALHGLLWQTRQAPASWVVGVPITDPAAWCAGTTTRFLPWSDWQEETLIGRDTGGHPQRRFPAAIPPRLDLGFPAAGWRPLRTTAIRCGDVNTFGWRVVDGVGASRRDGRRRPFGG